MAKEGQKPGNETNPSVAKQPEPRFTFYKILPEKEAIIPESEITNLKHQESLGKKPLASQYLLQAGSFANPLDAVKLKEKLTALKIKSHIENVKIENAAWNRVKIGPFKSLEDADKVRTYLRNNQLDSVVQKSVTKPPQTPAKQR
jgi:cell division protein FtsN